MHIKRLINLALVACLLLTGCNKNSNIADAGPDLDTKIGQMLIVGFRGLEADEQSKIIQEVKDYHLGGVVLFDYDVVLKEKNRNIKDAEQVKTLVKNLQQAASIPLMIAVDQEGGQVQRLKPHYGFEQRQSHHQLGKQNDLAATFEESKKIAMDLRKLGINTNFAPVVDLNINPESPAIGKKERSFSKDPQRVAAHASAYIKGQHDRGILSALKHFPGHGSAAADSHFGFTDVTQTWAAKELDPFASLIKKGEVDMVMTAHIFNEKLDANNPATLSQAILTDLLRNNMKFEGVVVTDDIQMKAIAEHYGFEEGIVKSIQAGVDMIIIGNTWGYDEHSVQKATQAIKQAVQDGLISDGRIDESYQRIQKMKAGILKGPCSCCGSV